MPLFALRLTEWEGDRVREKEENRKRGRETEIAGSKWEAAMQTEGILKLHEISWARVQIL